MLTIFFSSTLSSQLPLFDPHLLQQIRRHSPLGLHQRRHLLPAVLARQKTHVLDRAIQSAVSREVDLELSARAAREREHTDLEHGVQDGRQDWGWLCAESEGGEGRGETYIGREEGESGDAGGGRRRRRQGDEEGVVGLYLLGLRQLLRRRA